MRIDHSLVNRSLGAGILALGAFITGSSLYAQGQGAGHPSRPSYEHGDVLRGAPHRAPTGGSVVTGNGINYNGGPVMSSSPINLYYILYGNWSGLDATGPAILNTWAQNIAPSPYFNINTTYGDNTGNVPNLVTFRGTYSDSGSLGTSLNDTSIAALASNAINHGFAGSPSTPGVPDPNGLYMVLTAPGVAETTGFLSSYCGWHWSGSFVNGAVTAGSITGGTPVVKFAFIGNANGNGACTVNSPSPNGDVGADAMISVMAHELEETATDPEGNAWFDSSGEENADKCAWTFGAESTLPNGAKYNMTLNGVNYLIQQNWLNANGGGCALSYAASPDFSLGITGSPQSIQQGSTSQNYVVTATALNGFSDLNNINWSFTLPSGITATPNTGTGSSITFTLTAAAGQPAGPYSITVTGTDGPLVHNTTASLTVTAPDFNVSVSGSQTVPPGGTSGTYTATATALNGFTNLGSIVWTFGPPSGITVTPVTSTTGSSLQFTLTAASTVSAGSHSVTVTGTYGSLVHSVNATLVVSAPTYSLTTAQPNPQTVTRPTSGTKTVTYTIHVNAIGTFTSAVTLSASGGTTGVTPSITPPSSVTPGGTGTLSVAVTNRARTGTRTLTVTGTVGKTKKTTSATIIIQ